MYACMYSCVFTHTRTYICTHVYLAYVPRSAQDVDRCRTFVRAIKLVLQGLDESLHELHHLLEEKNEKAGLAFMSSQCPDGSGAFFLSLFCFFLFFLFGGALDSDPGFVP